MNALSKEVNNWYVLYTYANYEKKVNLSLLKNNVKTFLPLQKVIRMWSDRKKLIEVPLFPNYLFIQINEKDRFQVLGTRGVKKYITNEGRPVRISEFEISNIKTMLETNDVHIEQPFIEGDDVVVTSGPLEGITGILFKRMGKMRFGMRIEAINQTLSISICASLIKKTSRLASM